MLGEGWGYTRPAEGAAIDKYLPVIRWAVQTSITALVDGFAFTQYCRNRDFDSLRNDIALGKKTELVLLGWKDDGSVRGAFAEEYLPNVQNLNLAMETYLESLSDVIKDGFSSELR